MTENITVLDDKKFDEFIKKGNVVVDFYADWCGPCKIMAPHFEAAAEEMKGKVLFGKLDVDANTEIAQRFQVMSIPTTIFFKDGEQVDRTIGAIGKEEILEKIKESF